MKIGQLLTILALAFLSASAAIAQTTIADWTFDTTPPTTAGPLAADSGTGTATAVGQKTFTNYTGNPGKAWGTVNWSLGSYYQFQVSTIGLTGIGISYDQYGSGTGPADFIVQYSTDGVNFTNFGTDYIIPKVSTWDSLSTDLSSITALNNMAAIYIRIVEYSTIDINGTAAVGTAGTDRIDNVVVTASGFATSTGAPQIFTNPQSTNAVAGRTITLGVTASGTAPLYYQWYAPNLNTPLTDNGTISGSGSATLTLNNITTNQTGAYQVIITNSAGSITSSVALVTVVTPVVTNIAYLRTLQDHVNWAPTDTNTIFTVQGTVTTPYSMTASPNMEFYIQDGTGGIAVYVAGTTAMPQYGDTVKVTGPLGQYDGLLELNLNAVNPDQSVSDLGGGALPTPAPFVFSSAANIPYMEATEGSLVTVSNVYLGFTNADFLTGTVTMTNLSGQTFSLYVNASILNLQGTTIPPFASSVSGVLSQHVSAAPYTSGYEVDVTQYADVVPGTPLPPEPSPIPLNVQVSGKTLVLTWSDSSFNLQSSTNVNGPYTTVSASVGLSTYSDTETNQALFYRLMHP